MSMIRVIAIFISIFAILLCFLDALRALFKDDDFKMFFVELLLATFNGLSLYILRTN